MFLENEGYCPICEADAKFEAPGGWLRDSYKCTACGSIPRERALMKVINTHFPEWRTATVHESSPGARGATVKLKNGCENYIPSQYFPEKENGSLIGKTRVEDLEALTFEDESIDLHISQDVLEHVFDPAAVFSEINRTLKPGGMHIFTAPLVNKHKPTVNRAKLSDSGDVIHLMEPSYHGNPVFQEFRPIHATYLYRRHLHGDTS